MKNYNAEAAIDYAYKWALKRNPVYYNFDNFGLGGDCTNFVSQCLYAGIGMMNYTKIFGWYYISPSNRTPSWTGVQYLYNFLTANTGSGPKGKAAPLYEARPGDVIQLSFDGDTFSHSLFVMANENDPSSADNPDFMQNIFISAHTYDALSKPLSEYSFLDARLIQIS